MNLTTHLFVASRPVSWINTAFPFAAAYLLTGGLHTHGYWGLLVGTVFFLVPYNVAMYGINDVFDYASDLANPRKGGIEGGILPRTYHRATLIAGVTLCLPFVVALVGMGSIDSGLMLGLSLFAVAAYSVPGLRTKEIPILDSITSSLHFSSPAWFGLLFASGGSAFDTDLALMFAAFFLWGAASHAFGAVQDILPDRSAGISSIATALGARTTVLLALLSYGAAGILMACTQPPARWAALLSIPYVIMSARCVGVTDATSALTHSGWKAFLWLNYASGFIITLLMISTVHPWFAPH